MFLIALDTNRQNLRTSYIIILYICSHYLVQIIFIISNIEGKKMKYFASLLALLICVGSAFSQQTGKFDITLQHLNAARTVSLYIHPDYDSAKTYDVMVMLHGSSDSSYSMVSVAQQAVAGDSTLKGCIFIAPDGGDDPNSDFYVPKEDITIIDKCIDYVKENYNIDTNRIFLEGFSLGARSAMCYGLNNPSKFNTLILNTPAIQGPKDAMNTLADLDIIERINYRNASQTPMLITKGSDDILYAEPIQMAIDSLIKYNGKVLQWILPSSGHIIPLQSFTIGKNIFNGNMLGQNRIDLLEVINPQNTLYAVPNFTFKFRNWGNNEVFSCKFKIINGEKSKEYPWGGSLAPFEVMAYETEFPKMQAGLNEFKICISEINGIPTESPDTTVKHIFYTEEPNSLPYEFDFTKDNPSDAEWSIEESASLEAWEGYSDEETTCAVKYTNTTLMFFNYDGFREDLISPFFSFKGESMLKMSFDVLHNYFLYNSQEQEYKYGDTLAVSISTDGGETFEEIYSKTEEELATYATPFTDVQDQNFIYNIVPKEENWRTETIYLSEYANVEIAQIKFTIKNAMGGLTMIDNVKVETETSVEENSSISDINIYPNPAADYITVNAADINTYKVVDMLGNDLTTGVQSVGNTINVSSLVSGAYTLILNGKAYNFVVSK